MFGHFTTLCMKGLNIVLVSYFKTQGCYSVEFEWLKKDFNLEVPSEPSRTSKMEKFAKMVNGWKPLIILQKALS